MRCGDGKYSCVVRCDERLRFTPTRISAPRRSRNMLSPCITLGIISVLLLHGCCAQNNAATDTPTITPTALLTMAPTTVFSTQAPTLASGPPSIATASPAATLEPTIAAMDPPTTADGTEIPTSFPTLVPEPTSEPTPLVPLTTAFEPFVTMIFDNIQNEITPMTILSWQNLTSSHVKSFWNNLPTQSVFVSKVVTTPITIRRLDAENDENRDDDHGAFRIVPTWEFLNGTGPPPNADQLLLKAVSISYNQSIAYALLSHGDDDATPSVTTSDQGSDRDDDAAWSQVLHDNSELVQQLFLVPFEWGAAPFIKALTNITNNTIPVRLRSIQFNSAVPTMAPVLSDDEYQKVNDDDRTIIITVVITLLSLMFAAGYIIFLTQTEDKTTSGGAGGMGDRSSMAFGASSRYIYEEDDEDGDDDSSTAESIMEGGFQGRPLYHHHQDSKSSSNGSRQKREQEQPPIHGSSRDGSKTASTLTSSLNTASLSPLDEPATINGETKIGVIPLPPQPMPLDVSSSRSFAGSDREPSLTPQVGSMSLDSVEAPAALGRFYQSISMPGTGRNSFSRNGDHASVNGVDDRARDVDSDRIGPDTSRSWSIHERAPMQGPSPLAFAGFQIEVHDLDD